METKEKTSGYIMVLVGVVGAVVSIAGGNLMTTAASLLLSELGIYSAIID
ncbi:MAG: hypothetical protein M1117_00830 [Candidatus Thermoplasmatota archaeon]|uniref:Uncharacterized protein n=1 Tax=Candidatus Sysuiplasma superficiale TaxID=2823368 RepID=A0A8J8CCV2_9ARCH|nr:hypothetical protein [Candidatus Sysuiplasma superficiale]MCL4346446.1 hypothetical protein [Candidatus Thermoplasmatota archaeon]